jgi:hypothetical protein
MNLQHVMVATAGAPPSLCIQNLPAVDLVNALHEQAERDTLLLVLCFGDQIRSSKRAVTEGAAAIRNPANLIYAC